MSQLGQERQSKTTPPMSGLPDAADLCGFPNLFTFGPDPDERIAAKTDQFGIAVTTSNFHAPTTSFRPSALNLSWPLLL